MRVLIVYLCFLLNSGFVLADKFKSISIENRIKGADFIGLVEVINGTLIQSTPKTYNYLILVKDIIKYQNNLEKRERYLTTNCGLSLANEYLVYAFADSDTGVLAVHCTEGVLLETYMEQPNFKTQVIVPSYFVGKVPLLEGNIKSICQLTIEGKCEYSYEGKSIAYDQIKSIIKAQVLKNKVDD